MLLPVVALSVRLVGDVPKNTVLVAVLAAVYQEIVRPSELPLALEPAKCDMNLLRSRSCHASA